jgi:3-oxoacyl-[acyl-carrier protein] reductase
VAQELSLLGARCTLMARNEDALQKAVASLQGNGHGYLKADFSDPSAVKAALAGLSVPVHILVNNTGGPPAGPIETADPAMFEQYFRQHVINNQVLVQHCLPGMKAAGYGRVINIISTSVKIPIDNLGVSNTIRGAVASWAKSMSNELAQYGVTVNNILPGFTKTERLQALIKGIAERSGQTVEAVSQRMEREVPARRFGEASEVAAVAAFLATPAAAYVNGESIRVDGGRTGSI